MIAYIILSPFFAYKDAEEHLKWSLGTIGATAGEAWYKQTRGRMDTVQAWFDKGYRLRKVNIELIEEDPDAPFIP